MSIDLEAPPRKKRRGRRKSKAERLACKSSEFTSCDDLKRLLEGSSSCEWDAAQSLALRIGTLNARTTVVRIILIEHKAPRAAAHYAKRLKLQSDELLSIILSNSSSSPPPPLLLAQFLVELDENLLTTDKRLHHFLWPWLLQTLNKKEDKAAVGAAVHLLLHPTVSDNVKTREKQERGQELKRALVEKCLRTGKLLHLVPTHARAFADRITIGSSMTLEDEIVEHDSNQSHDEESQRRLEVAHRVQTVLRLMWSDARVLLFGSSVTGLLSISRDNDMKRADIDLCVLLPSAPHFHQETAPLVTEMKEHLSVYLVPDTTEDSEHVTAVTRARVPIVHFVDPLTSLLCDVCVNNVSALWNTRLLRWLLHGGTNATFLQQKQLMHVQQFCKWLRKWRHVKKRVVSSALNSYGLVLLALYYLQRASILPVLDCSRDAAEDELTLRALTEAEIDKRLEAADKIFVSAKQQSGTVQHWRALRCGFFRFYTCEFDYDHTVVSLRTKNLMSKTSKGWSRHNNSRLCLEDPIEIERDLGALCSKRALSRLRCAFAHACIVLSKVEKGDSNTVDVEADLMASWAYEDEDAQLEEEHTE